ncbi:hypothetical protein TBS_00200 [Thermobispora bispora]
MIRPWGAEGRTAPRTGGRTRTMHAARRQARLMGRHARRPVHARRRSRPAARRPRRTAGGPAPVGPWPGTRTAPDDALTGRDGTRRPLRAGRDGRPAGQNSTEVKVPTSLKPTFR